MPVSKTIVISCAGMGTRLGIGSTKALIDIDGKPLIIRQLELLKDFDDIRIVVGYQMEKVIEVVNSYRKDILFVFNHDYRNTGTGGSFSRAIKHAAELVGIEHHLDSKANKLSQGNEEDRRDADAQVEAA